VGKGVLLAVSEPPIHVHHICPHQHPPRNTGGCPPGPHVQLCHPVSCGVTAGRLPIRVEEQTDCWRRRLHRIRTW
jgi:hypothetical protein